VRVYQITESGFVLTVPVTAPKVAAAKIKSSSSIKIDSKTLVQG